MKLDPKNFKKVHEDEHVAILQHKDGHQIHIVKKPLKPEHKEGVKNLPMHKQNFDNGGPVQGDQQQQTQQPPPSDPNGQWAQRWGQMTKGFNKAHGGMVKNFADGGPTERTGWDAYQAEHNMAPTPDAAPDASIPTPAPGALAQAAPSADSQQQPMAPAAPAQPLPQQGAPNQDPYGLNAYNKAITGGFGNQVAGINAEAKAQGQMGQANAGILDQAVVAKQKFLQQRQAHEDQLWAERNQAFQDYKDGHIDPNRVLGNKSFLQKITSGVGLALGGLGAGHGGENKALNYLNGQISEDIKAQYADLDKKKNLLSANHQAFGDLDQATAQTRGMMTDIVTDQIAAQAAKSADPLAKARAQQLIGQLQSKSAADMRQVAVNKTLMGYQNAAGQGQQAQIPDQMDPNLPLSYRVNGRKHYAQSPKDAEDFRKQSQGLDALEDQAKQVAQFNSKIGISIPLSEANGRAKNLNDQSGVLLTKTLTSGGAGLSRLASQFKDTMPQAGALKQAEQTGKLRQTLQQIAKERARLIQAGMRGVVAPVKMQNTPGGASVAGIPDSEQ